MSDIQAEIRTATDGLAHRGSGQNWLARSARAGMVAQGVMYMLVGGLAIELASGAWRASGARRSSSASKLSRNLSAPSIARPSPTSSQSVREPIRRKPRWPRAGPTKSIPTPTTSRAPPTGGARPLKVLVNGLRRREAESPRLLQEQGVGPELVGRL